MFPVQEQIQAPILNQTGFPRSFFSESYVHNETEAFLQTFFKTNEY